MSNDWKYASLGEKERLDLIKGGNEEVYNSEKKRNASLRSLKSSLGLSTNDVDTWDSLIDEAKGKSKKVSGITDKDVAELTSSKASRISKVLNTELDFRRKKLESDVDEAKNDAEKELEKLAEWLANNGYSIKGNVAKRGVEKIKDDLSKTLAMIETEHHKNAVTALANAISKL